MNFVQYLLLSYISVNPNVIRECAENYEYSINTLEILNVGSAKYKDNKYGRHCNLYQIGRSKKKQFAILKEND